MKIRRDIVESIQAGGLAEVRKFLQAAIELEHSTIPVYQTALYSIKPDANPEASAIISSVLREEMLHMAIAANVLNALGGAPVIDKPGFIPVFPGPLPMGIGDLRVGLEKLTRGHVFNTFMAIEEPEQKLTLTVKSARLAPLMALQAPPPDADYSTIGQFYGAIIAKIGELDDDAFKHPSNPQVVDSHWYPASQLFAVDDAASAIAALTVIVDQGEGTSRSPLESPGGPVAHYYRFAEIVYARRLVADADEPNGFSYAGPEVALDPAGIWNLLPNAKTADYPPGSPARQLSNRFNTSYTSLLACLHQAFNGRPECLRAAIGVMFETRFLGRSLAATKVEGGLFQAAPTYEYAPSPV